MERVFLPQFTYNVNWGCPITFFTKNRCPLTLSLKCYSSYILRRIKTKLGQKLLCVVLHMNRALLSDSMIFRDLTAFQTFTGVYDLKFSGKNATSPNVCIQ